MLTQTATASPSAARPMEEVRFAINSPAEGRGFEPSVPATGDSACPRHGSSGLHAVMVSCHYSDVSSAKIRSVHVKNPSGRQFLGRVFSR